jgi:hypothetical protein
MDFRPQRNQESQEKHNTAENGTSDSTAQQVEQSNANASTSERKNEKSFPWLRRLKPLIEAVGIVFLIIYTGVTIGLWCSSRDANKLAHEHFLKDQRPYMWPMKIEAHPLKVGEPVRVNVFYANYGKTPALKEKSAGKVLIYVGEGTLKQADTFFANFDENKVIGGSEIIVPPGIPPNPKDSQAWATDQSDIIPKDQAAVDGIDKTDGSFAVVGVITYFDSYGTHYRSDYCAMHLANGNVAWCARHNEIH